MLIENSFEHGLRKQGWHRIPHLLLLEADRAMKLVGIRKGLDAGCLSHRQPSILLGMDQHILAKVADDYGRCVVAKAMVDSGVTTGSGPVVPAIILAGISSQFPP